MELIYEWMDLDAVKIRRLTADTTSKTKSPSQICVKTLPPVCRRIPAWHLRVMHTLPPVAFLAPCTTHPNSPCGTGAAGTAARAILYLPARNRRQDPQLNHHRPLPKSPFYPQRPVPINRHNHILSLNIDEGQATVCIIIFHFISR